eukprot:2156206-Pyramimonas_sp.AAC.1
MLARAICRPKRLEEVPAVAKGCKHGLVGAAAIEAVLEEWKELWVSTERANEVNPKEWDCDGNWRPSLHPSCWRSVGASLLPLALAGATSTCGSPSSWALLSSRGCLIFSRLGSGTSPMRKYGSRSARFCPSPREGHDP